MSAFTPKTNWVTPAPAQPAKRKAQPSNPDTLEICNDPLKDGRAEYGTKYDAILAKLKPGQAIKCQTAEVGRVAGAVRKWIETKNLKHHKVRSTRDYGDGMARVWMLVVKP